MDNISNNNLKSIKGVGDKLLLKLNQLGIYDIKSLLNFFPHNYIDMNSISILNDELLGQYALINVSVASVKINKGYKGVGYFKITGIADGSVIGITWFNQPYLNNIIKKGNTYKFLGKIETNNQIYEMTNPKCLNFKDNDDNNPYVPIYRTRGLIGQKVISNIIKYAIENYNFISTEELYYNGIFNQLNNCSSNNSNNDDIDNNSSRNNYSCNINNTINDKSNDSLNIKKSNRNDNCNNNNSNNNLNNNNKSFSNNNINNNSDSFYINNDNNINNHNIIDSNSNNSNNINNNTNIYDNCNHSFNKIKNICKFDINSNDNNNSNSNSNSNDNCNSNSNDNNSDSFYIKNDNNINNHNIIDSNNCRKTNLNNNASVNNNVIGASAINTSKINASEINASEINASENNYNNNINHSKYDKYSDNNILNIDNLYNNIDNSYIAVRDIGYITADVIKSAYSNIHFKSSTTDIENCKKIIYKENFKNEILSFHILRQLNKNKGHRYINNNKWLLDILKNVPYDLTASQYKAIAKIIDDLNKPYAMNRLLSGDVGSGKTIVALSIMYYAVLSGYQAVLLAPTEILSNQHYETACNILSDRVKIALLTSSTSVKEKNEIYKRASTGDIDIIIGTTSLLNLNLNFKKLSCVVIDESHRFGVANRATLEHKGDIIDTLIMTATPIPRSISMLLYGELDDTYINRRDNIDKYISTFLTSEENDLYDRIEREVALNNQAYIVCPRVEDSEGIELMSAIALYEKLIKNRLSNLKIALIHGKLKNNEKLRIMQDFKDKKIDVLVSTTVIEVGIDSKYATVIGVFNAERYGLSTLHQLRGRVGRNNNKSYCYLISKNTDNERLKQFAACYNGREIASLDYSIRGCGDYIGLRQSGQIDNLVSNLNEQDIMDIKDKLSIIENCQSFIERFKKTDNFNNYSHINNITLN